MAIVMVRGVEIVSTAKCGGADSSKGWGRGENRHNIDIRVQLQTNRIL